MRLLAKCLLIFSACCQNPLFAYFSDECECCPSQIILGADFLWWQPREDNLNFGIKEIEKENVFPTPLSVEKLDVLRVHYRWRPGFRLRLGYSACNDWVTQLSWVHYYANGKTSSNVPDSSFLQTIFLGGSGSAVFGSGFGPAQEASAKINLHINWIDFDLSKKIHFCDCFVLEPKIGVRGLWSEQKLRIQATAPPELEEEVGSIWDSRTKNEMWGCGLKGGLEGSWKHCSGLGLQGYFGGAVLYSHFRAKNNSLGIFDDVIFDFEGSDKIRNSTAMLDIAARLTYTWDILNYGLDLFLGWEQHIIFNYNQAALGGNLTLSGLTAGLDFRF